MYFLLHVAFYFSERRGSCRERTCAVIFQSLSLCLTRRGLSREVGFPTTSSISISTKPSWNSWVESFYCLWLEKAASHWVSLLGLSALFLRASPGMVYGRFLGHSTDPEQLTKLSPSAAGHSPVMKSEARPSQAHCIELRLETKSPSKALYVPGAYNQERTKT